MIWRAAAWVSIVLGLSSLGVAAAAQERPFLFSFTPTPDSPSGVLVHYDAGYADLALPQVSTDGLEQRLGLEARVGSRWTLLAASVFADEGGTTRAGYRGEALFDLRPGADRPLRLSVGGGIRREISGVNVLLGRAVVGLEHTRWRLLGNLLLEKPFEEGRDAVDLITSLGFGWKLKPALALGVEAVGEDLEGLWDKEEAEGGAKLFVGPVVHWALPSHHLQVTLGGGPVLNVRPTDLTSTAERPLGTGGRNGYTVRASVAYTF
jgi:hypothetical protein